MKGVLAAFSILSKLGLNETIFGIIVLTAAVTYNNHIPGIAVVQVYRGKLFTVE